MLIIHRKIFIVFNQKFVCFADSPCDIDGCDFVYFYQCKNNGSFEGFTTGRQLTAVIDLTRDLDSIWLKMSAEWRRRIRRAEVSNLKININQHYDEFYKMNIRFQKSKGFYSTFGFRNETREGFKTYGTLFTAEHQGEILVGNIYFEDKDHMKLWWSASKRLEVDRDKAVLISMANRLLHWEAIKYAKLKGITEYDWGSLCTEEEAAQHKEKQNLNIFKLGSGAEPAVRYSYSKAYSKIYKLGRYIYHLIKK